MAESFYGHNIAKLSCWIVDHVDCGHPTDKLHYYKIQENLWVYLHNLFIFWIKWHHGLFIAIFADICIKYNFNDMQAKDFSGIL